MTTGRINQVARPPPTPRAAPAVACSGQGNPRTRRAGSRSNDAARGPAAEECDTRQGVASPLAFPRAITAAGARNAPGLHRFHRIRRARPRPGALPSPTPVGARRGGRTGRRTRSAICRRPPREGGGRGPTSDLRVARLPPSGYAAQTAPREPAVQPSSWRGTNETRVAPAVGCSRQGNPRTRRAQRRSRASACPRSAGLAPAGARPQDREGPTAQSAGIGERPGASRHAVREIHKSQPLLVARRAKRPELRQRVHCATRYPAGAPAASSLRDAQSSGRHQRRLHCATRNPDRQRQQEHPQRVHCATRYPAGAPAASSSPLRDALSGKQQQRFLDCAPRSPGNRKPARRQTRYGRPPTSDGRPNDGWERTVPTRAGQYCFTRHMPLGGRGGAPPSQGEAARRGDVEGRFQPKRNGRLQDFYGRPVLPGARAGAQEKPAAEPRETPGRHDDTRTLPCPEAAQSCGGARGGDFRRDNEGHPAGQRGKSGGCWGDFRRDCGGLNLSVQQPPALPTAHPRAARGVMAKVSGTPLYTLNRIPLFATRSTKTPPKTALFFRNAKTPLKRPPIGLKFCVGSSFHPTYQHTKFR